ncbi:hypothetical protein ACHQM5_017528 [Ranunculus cassubicifolius]
MRSLGVLSPRIIQFPFFPQIPFHPIQFVSQFIFPHNHLVEISTEASPQNPPEIENGETPKSAEIVVDENVVQYVVLRRDLIDTWPLGSVVTQGCHASVSAIWANKDDVHTVSYCSPNKIDSMHKVTLEVKSETQLLNLSEKLKAGNIAHKLWIEQPENVPTCLATKPYPKSAVASFFKKLKLCK